MIRKAIVLILLGAFGLTGTVWAGTYSGGTGEPNNPYRIETPNDLNDIGNHVEDYNKCFVLVNDINLADYSGAQFNIIGHFFDTSNYKAFTGVFDGNGHTIWNFTYNNTDMAYVGIFRLVEGNARIENLSLRNVDVDVVGDTWDVGSLVGWMHLATIVGCDVEKGRVSSKGDYEF